MWVRSINISQFAARPEGFSTLVARVRDWRDEAVFKEAHDRWESRLPRRIQTSQHVFPSEAFVYEEEGAPPPAVSEQSPSPLQYSLWFRRPDRWRSEQVSLTPSGSVPLVTAVRVGTKWWTHWVRGGVVETDAAVSPDSASTKEFGPDFLLRPERFLADYELAEPPEPDTWLERAVWRAIVVPVLPIRHLGTHHELLIDREYGCVLRQAEFLDTKPFMVQETVAVAFNEELSDDLFPLDPPPSAPIGKTLVRRAVEEIIRRESSSEGM